MFVSIVAGGAVAGKTVLCLCGIWFPAEPVGEGSFLLSQPLFRQNVNDLHMCTNKMTGHHAPYMCTCWGAQVSKKIDFPVYLQGATELSYIAAQALQQFSFSSSVGAG